jgi:hypothetical protein
MMEIRGDDFAPVVSGRQLAPGDLRADLDAMGDLNVQSDLDLHLLRLLALHPTLLVRFRNQDLSRLDDATKQDLLNDMNDLLGIKPLRRKE